MDKKGWRIYFSVEHPVFTSYGSQDWYYDKNGKILHFPVDNYYYEGKRDAIFLGEKVTKYHRTITTYLNTLLKNGFVFQHIIEPQPPKEMLNINSMKDEMRRPMMLLISVKKNKIINSKSLMSKTQLIYFCIYYIMDYLYGIYFIIC